MSETSTRTNDTLTIDELTYDAAGLIPAVIQDAHDHAVLMVAWMDREALVRTLDSGDVWFFSRSRDTYWRKGETSGNTLRAVRVFADCDGDTLLIEAELGGEGVACHTGERSCFFRELAIASPHGSS
jgi:phosphoribosyl-AMP cyclohydrolase